MDYRYDSPCGIYCGACGILKDLRAGRHEERARQMNMPPEELKCAGCKTDTIADFCVGCKFRDCTKEKGIEFCFDCDEFPCAELVAFRNDKWPHHSTVLNNLDTIKEEGVAEWLVRQKKRWSCPECGESFTWYESQCEACGATLYDCRKEDEDLKRER
ncbi:MAG: DUF3795 domain-containing protein [Candidatus Coatesbacteria bacterium]|nr:DUF3795 domain-containing protein [Candidatus Coatesbacteria bacterium]